MSETPDTWVALVDEEGEVYGRFCPSRLILVIKRRGKERRFVLAKWLPPETNNDTPITVLDKGKP